MKKNAQAKALAISTDETNLSLEEKKKHMTSILCELYFQFKQAHEYQKIISLIYFFFSRNLATKKMLLMD